MVKKVQLPELGEDAPEEAEVSFWYVTPGEAIEEGEDLVEMVTDKAAFTVPSPVGGTVKELLIDEGENASVGQTMATIEE